MSRNGPARYSLHSAIGTGAYGSVYRARDRDTDRIVALKQVKIHRADNGCPPNLLREVAALKRLAAIHQDNLIELLDVCYVRESSCIYLVFEHLDIDLSTYLQRPWLAQLNKPLDRAVAFRQLMQGLAHLHTNALLHRDIKPANILLSRPYGHLKLADFGLTRVYTLACCLSPVVVTLWYRAPEVVLRNDYGTPLDMWSCGCVLAEMFLQQKPLFASQTDSDLAQLKTIFSTIGLPSRDEWPAEAVVPWESFAFSVPAPPPLLDGNENEDVGDDPANTSGISCFDADILSRRLKLILPQTTPPDAIDLIARLISFDPSARLTVFEALKHSFINNVSTYHGKNCEHCTATTGSEVSETDDGDEEEVDGDEGEEEQQVANQENEQNQSSEAVVEEDDEDVAIPTPLLPYSSRQMPTILRRNKRKSCCSVQLSEEESAQKRTTPASTQPSTPANEPPAD